MAFLVRPVRDPPAEHADHVHAVADGRPAAEIEEVASSWLRSHNAHGVDPASDRAPAILTPRELKERRTPLDGLALVAKDELDRLYGLVRGAGYTVLLCDLGGVAIEHRGEDRLSGDFRFWGTWLGAVWSEAVEGTNGIGTCITEERPITVHRTQHFRSRHKELSCSGAPVFGPDGRLLAIVDVSAINPTLSEGAHAMTGPLTVASARAIEERLFRERFCREWILALAFPDGSDRTMLLALDRHQQIIAADRAARACLLLDDRKIEEGVSLWSLFERDPAPFRRRLSGDAPVRLAIAGCNEPCAALLTPPPDSLFDGSGLSFHARPRLDLLRTLRQIAPPPPSRGGLTPKIMERIREHVDNHLGETIDLATLAAVAGVSVFHFARQFKNSAGITPHHYIVRRRIERAREMLARTELSLAEIAAATGFADQSHFARHFRQMTGTTPREFRWSLR